MKRKLRGSRGESIAESLVSILIVALAAVMFAGMVTASTRIIETSTDWMEHYYAAVSAINNQTELTGRVTEKDVTITIAGNGTTETVTAFVNDDMGATIASYIKQSP